MADYNLTVYTGTPQASVEDALNLLDTQLATVNTGSTIRLIDVKEVGPGKYFIPVLLHDND